MYEGIVLSFWPLCRTNVLNYSHFFIKKNGVLRYVYSSIIKNDVHKPLNIAVKFNFSNFWIWTMMVLLMTWLPWICCSACDCDCNLKKFFIGSRSTDSLKHAVFWDLSNTNVHEFATDISNIWPCGWCNLQKHMDGDCKGEIILF